MSLSNAFFNKSEEERGAWLLYAEKVRKLTEHTFKREHFENKELRGKGYVLDHMLSVRHCYEEGVPPDMAAHVCNLAMVSTEYNSSKGRRSSITFTELIESITEYDDFF